MPSLTKTESIAAPATRSCTASTAKPSIPNGSGKMTENTKTEGGKLLQFPKPINVDRMDNAFWEARTEVLGDMTDTIDHVLSWLSGLKSLDAYGMVEKSAGMASAALGSVVSLVMLQEGALDSLEGFSSFLRRHA
jgi:hypothetical protein